jgi:D-arabinose 1-dehydrogenase-like Zn-dependent alcohol dehydrogenase
MEETLKFAQLQDIDCMIEKFPLEKANEAYGE